MKFLFPIKTVFISRVGGKKFGVVHIGRVSIDEGYHSQLQQDIPIREGLSIIRRAPKPLLPTFDKKDYWSTTGDESHFVPFYPLKLWNRSHPVHSTEGMP